MARLKSNKAIAIGLAPEKNATLQLYNWVAYINQKVIDNFEKKYKCKVELTTFNTMTRLSRSSTRASSTSTSSSLPSMSSASWWPGKPSGLSTTRYIPNISQAWSDFHNPFYDQEWQYTVLTRSTPPALPGGRTR